MSLFTNKSVTVDSVAKVYQPYDRGASGSFVFRLEGPSVHAPRFVYSSKTDDATNDKFSVLSNEQRTCPSTTCDVDIILGTDLVKTDLRFLAGTSKANRATMIDTHIALLQELRLDFEDRKVMYS